MLTLDVDLALKPVSLLRSVIESRFRIPQSKQVLLISGGEPLASEERVCKYNSGTDTNPIFLFSMELIESPEPPDLTLVDPNGGQQLDDVDSELLVRAESSLTLPDTQATVTTRASVAQEMVRASNEQVAVCERVILDQHLQHQGWLAVVANLEDTATSLQRQLEQMVVVFKEYLSQREDYRESVDNFDEDLAVLHRIPVFPALLEAERSDVSMVGSVIPNVDSAAASEISLLEYTNSRCTSQPLEQVADSCYRSVETLDESLLQQLQTQVTDSLNFSSDTNMKEIKKVSERLQQLEKLLADARQAMQEQSDLAQSLAHNQQRASTLRDTSILPDLCASHKQQLKAMCKKYQTVCSIRRRCVHAKLELCACLHGRMKWVSRAMDTMAENTQAIRMYMEEIKRLKQKLLVIEQLHTAPSMYIAASVEVVRRKAFSERYLEKAKDLSDKFSMVHSNEAKARSAFQAKLKKHFLSRLFSGMDDIVPPFATKNPESFDDRLPAITLEDVERLRQEFPDLARSLHMPEGEAIANLLAKSIHQALTQEEGETLFSLKNMTKRINLSELGSVSVMHRSIGDLNRRKSNNPRRNRRASTKDSDSDSDNEQHPNAGGPGNCIRRRAEQKRKLTRSLPQEEAHLTLRESTSKTVINAKLHQQNLTLNSSAAANVQQLSSSKRIISAGFKVDSSCLDPSSSTSVDPSSSSAGGISMGPSSSSDGKHDASATSVMQESSGERLKATVRAGLSAVEASLTELKINILPKLRDDVQKDREEMGQELRKVIEEILARISMALEEAETKHKEALTKLADELENSNNQLSETESKLEVKSHKLEDCHREIENYRTQLELLDRELDKLKGENAEEKEHWRASLEETKKSLDEEKKEMRKRMLLDHELELESVRQELINNEEVAKLQSEIKRLQKLVEEKNDLAEALKKKKKLLETSQEEKFRQERERTLEILEATFESRERKAVKVALEEAESKHEEIMKEMEARSQEERKALTAQKEAMWRGELSEQERLLRKEMEETVTKLKDEQSAALEKALAEERSRHEEETARLLKAQEIEMTKKSKMDMDNLRARIRMMQTTGALDRSASTSESDLPIGVSCQYSCCTMKIVLFPSFHAF